MRVIAYLYQDLSCEPKLDPRIWGWELERVYQDFDPRRPQLLKLRQDCREAHRGTVGDRPAQYLLLRCLEDLGESLQEVTRCLTELETLGVTVVAIEQTYPSPEGWVGPQQTEGTSSPSSSRSPQIQLLELLAAMQTQQRSRRIRHGHAQNRLKGLPPPGKAPYGYRRGKDRYVLDRSTAPIVKAFFEQFLLYGSLRGAVRYLAQKYGKTLSVSTGRRWLVNPVYRGDLSYQQQEVLMDTHQPMISREEAAQVDRLLRRNRSLAPRAASAPRSLAGLVVCATCQSPMTISRVTAPRRSQEYLYLRPTDCRQWPKCKAIAYQQILEQTIQRICVELPQAVAGVNLPAMGRIKLGIEAEISDKAQILTQLPELVSTGILDQVTADLRAYKVQTEISALKKRLAQLPPINLQEIAKTVSIDQFWLDLSEAERRFYFREFIRQVKIVRSDREWSIHLDFIF
jgi:DNA invertase Pin-like site-specific DNA recombinase